MPLLYTSVAFVSNLYPPKLGKEPLSVFSPTFEFVPGFAYPFERAGL